MLRKPYTKPHGVGLLKRTRSREEHFYLTQQPQFEKNTLNPIENQRGRIVEKTT